MTSRQRVVYPGKGITKGEVLDYYEEIAPFLLPHLRNRPITLLRCPDGVGAECFFQKHGGEGTPDVVPRVHVKEPGTDEEPYVYIDELPAVIALVQLNVLEFHVWNSRVEDLEHPDQLVFDLDPGEGLLFERVVEAARDVEESSIAHVRPVGRFRGSAPRDHRRNGAAARGMTWDSPGSCASIAPSVLNVQLDQLPTA